MAKKKASKAVAKPRAKSARSSAAKSRAKPSSARIPTASRRVPRSRKSSKGAGTTEVVKQPLIDVTPEIKKDVVVVKAEPTKPVETKQPPVEKHEDFAKALTQEPPKKGFFSRLFGRS